MGAPVLGFAALARGRLGAAPALAALLLCIAPASAASLPLGYQKSAVALVVLKQQHTLEQALAPAGVDVRWVQFPAGPPMMEAMNAGAIDIGYTGESPPIFAQAAGADIVYLAVLPTTGQNQGVLARRDGPLHNPADLRGRRVAFAKGSSAHYAVLRILSVAGLSASDIHPVFLPPADGRAAISTGSVDAWVIWDPFLAEAQQDPTLRTLSDASAAPSGAYILAPRAYATAHPDIVMTTLRAIKAAAGWAAHNTTRLAALMTDATGVDLAAEQVSVARANFSVSLMDAPAIRRQQGIADLFAAAKLIPAPVNIDAAVWTPPRATGGLETAGPAAASR